jgi:hypothetical protein
MNTAEMNKLKIINANQGTICKYENTRRKLLTCNADIYFNKPCIMKRIIPKFAKMKITGNSPVGRTTKHNSIILCLTDLLNNDIYIFCLAHRGNLWNVHGFIYIPFHGNPTKIKTHNIPTNRILIGLKAHVSFRTLISTFNGG